jgi:hypothetical protein
MGLLESLLNVPQQLRVWQMSGVRYFYLSEPSTVSSETVSAPTDPVDWDAPWSDILAKAPRHPALVLTYLDLGRDLTGQGDSRRSTLWRKLIHDLGWSGQNKIAFWPVALPDGQELNARPDLFLQGLRFFSPTAVAFFGHPSASRLMADPDPVALSAMTGLSCLILPDPDDLLRGDKEEWDAVLRQLGQV